MTLRTSRIAFLEAFGNKETTIKRLRAGASNKSDLGGVLQTNNIHIAVLRPGRGHEDADGAEGQPGDRQGEGEVHPRDRRRRTSRPRTWRAARRSPAPITDFPDHFGFFLPLAGITTVKQISENAFDIRATSRLNRLYVELLKDNPDWGTAERRHDMNHFMARLIFCFFAEDTDIFNGKRPVHRHHRADEREGLVQHP